GAGEEDCGGDRPGPDELDVAVPGDLADERPEAEAEREQVDRRLDRRRERRRAPVRREVDDLAHEHAGERGALEAAEARPAGRRRGRRHSISSPVSKTKTSSGFAGRRSPSGARPSAPSMPSTEMLVPVRRVRRPSACAWASTSASLAGGP